VFAAQAQDLWSYSRFYFKSDIGGTLTQDTDLKEFFGENTTGAKVKFNPGFRMGFTGGFLITSWFAVEFETGFMDSGLDTITGGPSFVDATLSNVPFLANARFQLPNRSRFRPYVGVGAGGSASILDAFHIDFKNTHLSGTETEVVFAYQGFAGLRYELSDRSGVSLEYHYFATEEPTWTAEATFGAPSDKMRFGSIGIHAFCIAFDYRF
jgi:opacity protein-like surface antigen